MSNLVTEQERSYRKRFYPFPIELHHTNEECQAGTAWVSIKEQSPKVFVKALVTDGTTVLVGYYNQHCLNGYWYCMFEPGCECYGRDIEAGADCWHESPSAHKMFDGITSNSITHWMLLPEPPETTL